MSAYETQVRKKLEGAGYTVLKNGDPDFKVFRQSKNGKILDFFYVEVKGRGDSLRDHQILTHELLRKIGFKVIVDMEISQKDYNREAKRRSRSGDTFFSKFSKQYEKEIQERLGEIKQMRGYPIKNMGDFSTAAWDRWTDLVRYRYNRIVRLRELKFTIKQISAILEDDITLKHCKRLFHIHSPKQLDHFMRATMPRNYKTK